jgi:hypothetical protein
VIVQIELRRRVKKEFQAYYPYGNVATSTNDITQRVRETSTALMGLVVLYSLNQSISDWFTFIGKELSWCSLVLASFYGSKRAAYKFMMWIKYVR